SADPVPLAGWNVCERGVLAELKRADVGDDRPSIGGGDLRRVVGHGAEAVGDDVEKVSDGRLAKAVLVIRRRTAIAAPHDHPVALAGTPMTGRAKDVEALLAAGHHARVDRERKDGRVRLA